jgi:adenylylsulfate kinase
MKRILIMGLPGAGKTTLAKKLKDQLQQTGQTVKWLNADQVRGLYNDWDFTETGRLRQAQRMRELADKFVTDYVIADFVAPLSEMRDAYSAHYTIWMDTIQAGRFEDTNQLFMPPQQYHLRITDFSYQIDLIVKALC